MIDGRARGIVARDMVTGEARDRTSPTRSCSRTGGYGNVFYLATYAKGCNATAIWRAYKKGAAFANPCYTQIHPTCIPVTGDHQSKLTLMSESLRNDGRIWVPKKKGDTRPPRPDPRGRARLLPRAQVPELRQPRPARHRLARGQAGLRRGPRRGPGPASASTSTSPTRSSGSARRRSREKYGNLFEMYERITDEDPYKVPMRIYPGLALHDGRALGRLQPDEHDPRAARAAARRTSPTTAPTASGASALMQGLADGYFVLPYTIGHYLASHEARRRSTPSHPEAKAAEAAVEERTQAAPRHQGQAHGRRRSTASSARSCGSTAAWPATRQGLETALQKIPALREEFWKNVNVPGQRRGAQPVAREGRPRRRLPRARRADVPATRSSARSPAAATSARSTRPPDGEALRDDEHFCHVAAWEYDGRGPEARCATSSRSPSRTSTSQTRSYK